MKWVGINVTINPLYLLEALNYWPGNYVNLNSDGDELGPIIVEYLDVKLAACIMPMRH
jgi:DNA polymerase III sliding clamp (beta) subunit (PCNA family)